MRLLPNFLTDRPTIPDGELVFAIGDIHGRNDLLGQLHQRIAAQIAGAAPSLRATVIYLGDYIDRGPDSKGVVETLLRQPVKGACQVFLKGNHEDSMIAFLAGRDERWLSLGGGATARSYGISLWDSEGTALETDFIRAQISEAIPADHMGFFQSLQLYHCVGDYLFVHAGIRPGLSLENQAPSDLLWIRSEFLRSRRRHERFVVHGHSSSREAVVRRNRICIDTMAYATDRLSCLVLEGKSRRIISVQS